MRTRARRIIITLGLALALALALTGCVEPDLGEAPVYCNLYEPRCPAGYVCQRRGTYEVCLREGSQPPTAADGGAGADGVQAP